MTNSYLWFMSSHVKALSFFMILIIATIIPVESIAGNNSLKSKNDNALDSKVSNWINSASIRFVENKGQMADMNGHALNNLLFKVNAAGVDVYITTNGISYVFTKIEKQTGNMQHLKVKANENDAIAEHYCRADMNLVGANIKRENIATEGESEDKTDYYLGSICPNGILNVHNYTRITIKNIYPGIDWVLYTNRKGLKYDFVVHPGANYSLIKLKYNWTDKPEINSDGSVQLNTPMGKITEGAPLSYSSEVSNKIKTKYIINNNEIGFSIDNYDKAQTLTIDPTLIWSTFYGGDYNALSYSVNSDKKNVWVTGTVPSHGFPVYNPGGGTYFQGATGSANDAFILKFNTKGVRLWATYYGGSKGEEGLAINSDGANVWATGFTSSTDFPTLNSGGGVYYQSTLLGKLNAFVLKFSTAGILKWATYYGGNGEDYGESINSDGTNVWLTGFTTSTNFPTQNPGGGAYYQNTNADSVDAFILQFDTLGTCKWATYYGGNGDDYGQSINSDGTNVWVAGYTRSTNLQTLNPAGGAYYQAANAGGNDAFIAQFNTLGVCKWATYYGGSGNDEAYSINSDKKNVWLTGATTSYYFPRLNPVDSAYFQDTIGGGNDIFLLKFDPLGIRKWATYYGGYSDDFGYSINSDGTNVWVTGATWTQNNTSNYPKLYLKDPRGGAYFQSSDPGGLASFVLEFNTDGTCKWATYFGWNYIIENSIQSDGTNVWIAGYGYGFGIPTLDPGGGAYYQNTTDSIVSNQLLNAVISQFSTCSRIFITLDPKPANICIGDSVKLIATGGNTYAWSPSAGLSSTSSANPNASPASTTAYTVDFTSGYCSGVDTVAVNVIPKPIPKIAPSQSICMGSNVSLNASGGSRYIWSPSVTLNNDSIADPTAKPNNTTTYSITISNQACSVEDSVTITVNPLPIINVCCNTTINGGQTATLTVSPSPTYYTYNWQPPEGLNCTTCPNPIASPFTTTTYSVTVIDSLGCDTVGYVTIDVNCDAFVPDAFSPNGDGQNDILYVRGDCVKTIDFAIFDRWGNKVFETNDKTQGWNGSYKGEPMNTGSYVYYLSGSKYDGTSISKKGNITLVR